MVFDLPDYNMIIDPEDITKLILYIGMIFGVIAIGSTIIYIFVLSKDASPEAEVQVRNYILMSSGVFGATLAYWYKYS